MSDITYAVDGIPLMHPSNYWWLEDDIVVGSNLERRASNMVVSGRDGSIYTPDETLNTTQIGLKMLCNAAGGRTVEETRSALLALLGKRSAPVVLTRTFFGASVSADAKLNTVSNDDAWIETHDSVRFTAVMDIPGVYFRDTSDQTWTQQTPVSGTTYRVTSLNNSVAEIRDAKIKLTGPMTLPVFKDIASGSSFSLGTISAGRMVIVDCATGYAYESAAGTSWALTGTDITATLRAVGPGSGRRIISLTPAITAGDPFDRRVNISLTSTGLVTASKIDILARRCFL